MKRILQINAGSGIFGGVEAFLVNLYREIHDEVQFDFLTLGCSTYDECRGELLSYGARVYSLDIEKLNLLSKIRIFFSLLSFFRKHHYEYVQVNTGGKFTQIICLFASKVSGIKCRIAHTHSTGNMTKNGVDNIFSLIIANLATEYFACSKLAAKAMFPDDRMNRVTIVNNAIDTTKYRFNKAERERLRKKYDLDNKIVIGTVGRFHECKNHVFLLDILKELKTRKKEVKLVMIGEGELKSAFEMRAKEMGIYDNVLLLGQRNDVNVVLNMLDFFLLPSFYEGLPVVAVEAQANDLVCIMSKNITNEVKLTERAFFEEISTDSVTKWADIICEYGSEYDRGNSGCFEVREKGYDSRDEANKMKEIYKVL